MPKHVLVIGCGIIGAASAYFLRKAGWDVSMVDRGQFGQGASHGNCGLVSPSHVLPLSMPGTVRKTLPMLFRRDAPLRVKPRFDPILWYWLFRFAQRCRHKPMIESANARLALLQSSAALYPQLIEEESLQCEFERRGCIYVFQTQKAMDDYAKMNDILVDFGVGGVPYEGSAINQLEPALKTGLAGGWHHVEDAHLRPDKLVHALRKVLMRMGVAIYEKTEVRGFARQGNSAMAVDTGQGQMSADRFVVATGAWTPQLNHSLGTRIPIQPGKGYSITMPRPALCPKIPLVFAECKVMATPMQSGYRLGSTMEFAGYDTSLDPVRLQMLKTGAADYLREPYCEPVEEEWYGWRPMTFDGIPVIDRAPAMSNVYIAAGHNMLGVSMGAGTGKLIAELICGEAKHIDPMPYSLSRLKKWRFW